MVRNGRLVSQYPEFLSLIAAPFYALFGFAGLMILNGLSFLGICALTWRMTGWFCEHRVAPFVATAVYAFATFAWEYTQSSYPHFSSIPCLFGNPRKSLRSALG